MKATFKSILFWFILLTLTLGTIELTCYVTLGHFKKRFNFFDFNKYFVDEAYIKNAYKKYHPERGWDNYFHTRFGERPRSIEYNKSLISAFGDSFIFCDGVKDNESWEERLSMLLKENIYNFGVGGYGTDQAYLKFLSIFQKVRTPIVVLGVFTENINRIVNVYRPFYYEYTGLKLTKPRFILKQDRLSLLPNPVRTLDEIGGLNNAFFLSRIGQNDFWFNHDRYPEFRFPYSKILFKKRVWLEMLYARDRHQISDLSPRPYANLWEDDDTVALMFKILESFIAHVKNFDAIPIIMIFPSESEATGKFTLKNRSIAEKNILDFCRNRNILVFNAIEALVNRADSVNEIESFFIAHEHLSTSGNQIIAESLYDFLKEHALSTGK